MMAGRIENRFETGFNNQNLVCQITSVNIPKSDFV